MPQVKYRKNEQHLIENYELAKADNFEGWVIHHRLEFDLEGNEVHTPKSLKKLGMYWRRPYFELIYMRRSDHQALHNSAKKGKFSEERKKHLSEGTKRVMSNPEMKAIYDKNRHRFPIGNSPWNKGTGKPKTKGPGKGHHKVSDEAKQKISNAKKKYWETHTISEEQQKKMAKSRLGKKRGKYKLKYSGWSIGPDGKRIYK